MTAHLETRLRAAAAAVNDVERERDVPPFRPAGRGRGRRGPVLAAVAVVASVALVVGLLWNRDDGPAMVADAPVEVTGLFPVAGGSTWTYDVTRNGAPDAVLMVVTEPVLDGAEPLAVHATWRTPGPVDEAVVVADIETLLPRFDDGRFAVPLAVLFPGPGAAACTDLQPFVIDPASSATSGTAVLSCGGEAIRIGVVSTPTTSGHVLALDGEGADLLVPARLELEIAEGVGLTAFDMDGSVVGVLADLSTDEQGADG